MSVQVYGCNHVAIEVDDVDKAVAFYQDVFNLQKLDEGEGDAFFKLGEHQFLAIFKVEEMKPDRMRHFGIMVRDEAQLAEVRDKITKKYGLKLIPGFRCDFRDPFGNRIQVWTFTMSRWSGCCRIRKCRKLASGFQHECLAPRPASSFLFSSIQAQKGGWLSVPIRTSRSLTLK